MQMFYYFSVMAGNRSLPEAMMTMVPEAWQNDTLMPEHKYFQNIFFKKILCTYHYSSLFTFIGKISIVGLLVLWNLGMDQLY